MSRSAIPEDTKQYVRQKCGFGCVVCGLPVFQYDHVHDYADVQEHDPDNLVLLCATHHNEKTVGRLSREAVQKAAIAPINKTRLWTGSHPLHMVGTRGQFEIGTNIFEFDFGQTGENFEAIRILGQTIFGMHHENGHLLLDVVLSDRRGETILKVERGELIISTSVWDYKFEGRNLHIRSGERQIELHLELVKEGVRVTRGFVVGWQFGLARPRWSAIQISPDEVRILPNNSILKGGSVSGCRRGLVIN